MKRVKYSAFLATATAPVLERSFTTLGSLFKFKNELLDVLGLDIRCVRIIVAIYDDDRMLCNRFVGNYLAGSGQFVAVGPEFASVAATHSDIDFA